jgi:Holliday junction resolvase-like predicted endonuclease
MDPDVIKITQLAVVAVSVGAVAVVLWSIVHFVKVKTRPSLPARDGLDAIDEARFARLEQAVDTIAIEVERMAEAQRFNAKLLSERASETMTGRPTRE